MIEITIKSLKRIYIYSPLNLTFVHVTSSSTIITSASLLYLSNTTKNITHTHRWQSPVSLLCVCIILILWLERAANVTVVVILCSCRYSKCFAYLLLGRWCVDSSHSTTPLTSVPLITCEASRTRNEK